MLSNGSFWFWENLQIFTFLVAQNIGTYFPHIFVFKEEDIFFSALFPKFFHMSPLTSKGNCILIQINSKRAALVSPWEPPI